MSSDAFELPASAAGTVAQTGGAFRLGSVDSLNAAPLTRGLEDRVTFTTPARLGALLRAGELDAALLSVTELLANPGYTALDGIAIASRGPVRSVVLAHRRPLHALDTVHCDPASLASVHLLRVLLAARGLHPRLVPLPDYAAAPGCDAVLLIGDRALDFAFGGHPHQLWDLGAAWWELTGLPFVYALWTLRPGADAAGLAAMLGAARARGLAELETIIAGQNRYPPNFCREYLTWNIRFDLGPAEKRGLLAFAERLRHLGNGPVHPPRFAGGEKGRVT